MISEISKNQVLDRIRFEKPWWIEGKNEADYHEVPRRLYFELFKPLVKERAIRRAVVLMGPRRVGKTVMLYHMVQELIEDIKKHKQQTIDVYTELFSTLNYPAPEAEAYYLGAMLDGVALGSLALQEDYPLAAIKEKILNHYQL